MLISWKGSRIRKAEPCTSEAKILEKKEEKINKEIKKERTTVSILPFFAYYLPQRLSGLNINTTPANKNLALFLFTFFFLSSYVI